MMNCKIDKEPIMNPAQLSTKGYLLLSLESLKELIPTFEEQELTGEPLRKKLKKVVQLYRFPTPDKKSITLNIIETQIKGLYRINYTIQNGKKNGKKNGKNGKIGEGEYYGQ